MKEVGFPNFNDYLNSHCEECSRRMGDPVTKTPANENPAFIICKLDLGNCPHEIEKWANERRITITLNEHPQKNRPRIKIIN